MTIIDQIRRIMKTSTADVRVSRFTEEVEGSISGIYSAVAILVGNGELVRVRNGVVRLPGDADRAPAPAEVLADSGWPPQADRSAAAAPEPPAAAQAFHAMLHLDGDLDLHGLVELADGGYRLAAGDVERLRVLLGPAGTGVRA